MNEKEKEKLLLNESYLTFTLLSNGLNTLKISNIFNKGQYYQSFFSLSMGLERLLKIAIITKYRSENNEQFPSESDIEIKSFGHDLNKLMNYLNIEITDEIEIKVLNLLNDFSKKSRYFNIDSIINNNTKYNDPLYEWSKISDDILLKINKIYKIKNREVLINMFDEFSDIYYYDLNRNLINNSLNMINEYEKNETVNKYGIQYIFEIIRKIVWKIHITEGSKNMMPVLKEVFAVYLGTYTPSEIRNKKDWFIIN